MAKIGMIILIATATIRIHYAVLPFTGIVSGEIVSSEQIKIGEVVTER